MRRWAASAALGCASSAPPPPTQPVSQGADDAILGIARVWESRVVDKGLRSSPSPIAAFESHVLTRIELVKDAPRARQVATYAERFGMRDGGSVECETRLEATVNVRYGRRRGEAAAEFAWAAARAARTCNAADPRIPAIEVTAGRSRFALRSDRLVGVEPALEKRTFLPLE